MASDKPLTEKLFGNRLIKAAEAGNTDACQRQLSKRGIAVSAKVNTRHRKTGNTPLHQACIHGHVCTCKLLLEKGAKINANNQKGETPLMLACRHRQVQVVQYLLETFYKTTKTPSTRNTRNSKENDNSNSDNTDMNFSASGCNVNEKNNAGWTALHYVCSFVHRNKKNTLCIDLAYLLLNHGAHINLAANNGWTALHFAAHKGHVRLCKALLDRGAWMDAKNKVGKTPVQIANHGCKPQVLLDYQRALQERALQQQEDPAMQRSLLTSSVALRHEQQKSQAEQEVCRRQIEQAMQTMNQLLATLEGQARVEQQHTVALRQQVLALEERANQAEQEKVDLMDETVSLLQETVDLKAQVSSLERENRRHNLKAQLHDLEQHGGTLVDETEATDRDLTDSVVHPFDASYSSSMSYSLTTDEEREREERIQEVLKDHHQDHRRRQPTSSVRQRSYRASGSRNSNHRMSRRRSGSTKSASLVASSAKSPSSSRRSLRASSGAVLT